MVLYLRQPHPPYRLEDLGSAEQAGQRFLSTTVAPEGSGREATLLAADARCTSSL
jgi:hypothetical protein